MVLDGGEVSAEEWVNILLTKAEENLDSLPTVQVLGELVTCILQKRVSRMKWELEAERRLAAALEQARLRYNGVAFPIFDELCRWFSGRIGEELKKYHDKKLVVQVLSGLQRGLDTKRKRAYKSRKKMEENAAGSGSP